MGMTDKLVTIAGNEQKVYYAGQLKTLADAECLNGKLQGTTVKATDVINIEHNVPCKLESKNLFDGEFVILKNNAVKIETLSNGVRIIKDVSSQWCSADFYLGKVEDFKNQTITVSCNVSREKCDDLCLAVDPESLEGETKLQVTSSLNNKMVLTGYIDESLYSGQIVLLRLYVDTSQAGEKGDYTDFTDWQIEYGSTATPYTPYITDFSKIEGKNLFNPNNYVDNGDGGWVQVKDNGTILLEGYFDTSPILLYTFDVIEKSILSINIISEENGGAHYLIDDKGWNYEPTILSVGTHTLMIWQYTQASSEIQIQLEKGTVATEYVPYVEPKNITVTRYGKNLYDISKGLYKDILVDNGDGSYTLTKTNNGVQSKMVSCFIPANTDITLSVDVIEYTGTWWTPFPVQFHYDDGTGTSNWLISVDDWDRYKIRTYKTTKNIIGFQLVAPGTNDLGTYTKFKDFQIELGTTGTTYEPFKGIETYQSTADGTVDGITSIAPNMTLLTNAEGVIINANYYKDPDIVISNLQQAVAMSGGE